MTWLVSVRPTWRGWVSFPLWRLRRSQMAGIIKACSTMTRSISIRSLRICHSKAFQSPTPSSAQLSSSPSPSSPSPPANSKSSSKRSGSPATERRRGAKGGERDPPLRVGENWAAHLAPLAQNRNRRRNRRKREREIRTKSSRRSRLRLSICLRASALRWRWEIWCTTTTISSIWP